MVSARKPIITRQKKENVSSPTTSATEQQSESKDPTDIKQFTPFSIDNIVNKIEKCKEKKCDVEEILSELPVKGKEVADQHMIELLQQKNKENDTNNSKMPNTFDSYSFADKSSEVKHALTPIDRVPTETHSPQLPLPSPNYPVQAQSIFEPTVSTLTNSHGTTNTKLDSKIHSITSTNKFVHKSSVKNQEKLNNDNLKNGIKMNAKNSFKSISNLHASTESNFTVLNIPNVLLPGPPLKRQKVSKIDLALLKHKMRKRRYHTAFQELPKCYCKDKFSNDYGVRITGPSESSSSSLYSSSESEDESGIDLFIKSGPPLKPDASNGKLEFLKIFQLTTQNIKTSTLNPVNF